MKIKAFLFVDSLKTEIMHIETSKIHLVKAILNSNDEEFISRLIDFVNKENADFWHELTPEEKAEIKEGINQLDRGNRKPFRQLLKS
ncbi:hypothetical protein [Algoriphagus sp.]|uniref:hypothetical protein n=1 Tax=Algoriphagus sp. TaxID=1872435 RepID=UPI002726E052|nr:hypothetical protein [Algoriphagus sp.]MDO8968273.1 hypothetical protein [Algoriphagus sp.]MDP3200068.1 hypothetical protein [Algoriphagus sp.]